MEFQTSAKFIYIIIIIELSVQEIVPEGGTSVLTEWKRMKTMGSWVTSGNLCYGLFLLTLEKNYLCSCCGKSH